MRRGLLLLTLAACTPEAPKILSTTVPGDTPDSVGPYVVQMVVRGVVSDDDVQVDWSLTADQGSFAQLHAEERDGRSDLWHADIPGQPPGSRVYYYSAVVRDGEEVDRDPPIDATFYYSFTILPAQECQADSDCVPGVEVCSGGQCLLFNGTCATGPNGEKVCPGGYVCDETRDPDLCVIAPLPCRNDDACPATDFCDHDRGMCEPRFRCGPDLPCPDPLVCHDDVGLCFDS